MIISFLLTEDLAKPEVNEIKVCNVKYISQPFLVMCNTYRYHNILDVSRYDTATYVSVLLVQYCVI